MLGSRKLGCRTIGEASGRCPRLLGLVEVASRLHEKRETPPAIRVLRQCRMMLGMALTIMKQ